LDGAAVGEWWLKVHRLIKSKLPPDITHSIARTSSPRGNPWRPLCFMRDSRCTATVAHRVCCTDSKLQSILPQHPSPKPRPIIYNSWEATGFNVDEANQLALAEKAAKLGVERFVIDDGWFGKRNSDHAGLGDWQTNR
jgi:hypothetical protein